MVPVLYFRIRANFICGSVLYHCASKYWKSKACRLGSKFPQKSRWMADLESKESKLSSAWDEDPGRFGKYIVYLVGLAAPASVKSKLHEGLELICSSEWTYEHDNGIDWDRPNHTELQYCMSCELIAAEV